MYPSTVLPPTTVPLAWSKNAADLLQQSVDKVFGNEKAGSLLGLKFSFTIADPLLEDCPLIGCSTGFTELTGYSLEDILGRNCRFLIERVPKGRTDDDVRRLSKDFCTAVAKGQEYFVPDADKKSWMPPAGRPGDELLSMQKNARKDGTLFNNLFYMKMIYLSMELGEGQPYIVALQSEMTGTEELAELSKNLELIDSKMEKVKSKLAALFLMQCSMARQLTPDRKLLPVDCEEVADEIPQYAPGQLCDGFDPGEVQVWSQERFQPIQKLCDASRNRGVVNLMRDTENDNQKVAVKMMPNLWCRTSHANFIAAHPKETEMPWMDVGCTKFLNGVGYKYACTLNGVYRSKDNTFVTSSFAAGGDLFSLALARPPSANDDDLQKKEASFGPLVIEIFNAVRQLHDLRVMHQDISLENVLLTASDEIRVIDFGMSSTVRMRRNWVRGKMSYQAPEMHSSEEYDAILSDEFSVGVVLYALFMKDYPWMSTVPSNCKHFEFVKKYGFRTYASKRKARGTDKRVADMISEPLLRLIEGLLELDPSRRLTLGEEAFGGSRRSVWDEPWTQQWLDSTGGKQ
jgi:hypothetical protein